MHFRSPGANEKPFSRGVKSLFVSGTGQPKLSYNLNVKPPLYPILEKTLDSGWNDSNSLPCRMLQLHRISFTTRKMSEFSV
ncbi:Exocyst Complex Component 5 [Manis pentadactyla]|nr:Exocyst Complex Component 5 [Manis pentadactyla]